MSNKAFFIGFLFLLVISSCSQFQNSKCNVLLITLDTTRADHLSCYGYKQKTTPNIDQIVSEGAALFENCFAEVPITLPSHTCILTGQYPLAHGVRDNGLYRLSESALTLAEILHQQGYLTSAFISGFPLDSQFNLGQGFDLYDDDLIRELDRSKSPTIDEQTNSKHFERTADQVNKKVFKWLEANFRKPFFLWVHYFDPHEPYQPPEPFKSQFSHPYDGEIAFCDESLGQILNLLKDKKILENTLIIIAGDHGESLGQHNEQTHAYFIYNSTLQVPLIIYNPKQRSFGNQQRIQESCELIDLMPTILDLLELPIPDSCQGQSLKPALEGQSLPPKSVYLESQACWLRFNWSILYGLEKGNYKYIRAPRPELYNLEQDPNEINNIYQNNQTLAKELDLELQQYLDKYSNKEILQKSKFQPNFETREKLEALGYMMGISASAKEESSDSASSGMDPKDGIKILAESMKAIEIIKSGDFSQGMNLLKKLQNQDPNNPNLAMMIADRNINQGLFKEAEEEAGQALKKFPERSPMLNLILGRSLLAQARYEEAADCFMAGLKESNVEVVELSYYAGLALEKLGKYEQAIEIYQKGLNLNSKNLGFYLNLANCYSKLGKNKEALEAYKGALRTKPNEARIYYNIGVFYANLGNLEEAVKQINIALKINPDYQQAHFNLGILFEQNHELGSAIPHFEAAYKILPDSQLGQKSAEILEKIKTEKNNQSTNLND